MEVYRFSERPTGRCYAKPQLKQLHSADHFCTHNAQLNHGRDVRGWGGESRERDFTCTTCYRFDTSQRRALAFIGITSHGHAGLRLIMLFNNGRSTVRVGALLSLV